MELAVDNSGEESYGVFFSVGDDAGSGESVKRGLQSIAQRLKWRRQTIMVLGMLRFVDTHTIPMARRRAQRRFLSKGLHRCECSTV